MGMKASDVSLICRRRLIVFQATHNAVAHIFCGIVKFLFWREENWGFVYDFQHRISQRIWSPWKKFFFFAPSSLSSDNFVRWFIKLWFRLILSELHQFFSTRWKCNRKGNAFHVFLSQMHCSRSGVIDRYALVGYVSEMWANFPHQSITARIFSGELYDACSRAHRSVNEKFWSAVKGHFVHSTRSVVRPIHAQGFPCQGLAGDVLTAAYQEGGAWSAFFACPPHFFRKGKKTTATANCAVTWRHWSRR